MRVDDTAAPWPVIRLRPRAFARAAAAPNAGRVVLAAVLQFDVDPGEEVSDGRRHPHLTVARHRHNAGRYVHRDT